MTIRVSMAIISTGSANAKRRGPVTIFGLVVSSREQSKSEAKTGLQNFFVNYCEIGSNRPRGRSKTGQITNPLVGYTASVSP